MGVSNIKDGAIYPTRRFGDVEVVKYTDKYNIKVRFIVTDTEINTNASALRKGSCVDNNQPSLFGVGYLDYGEHSTRMPCGKKKTRAYEYWSRMIRRCYDINSKDYSGYGGNGVTVCAGWHNFQNFAEWFYNQPFHDVKGYHLDKDMTVIGNKEYSSETCNLIPPCVNLLAIKRASLGVYWHSSSKKWATEVSGKAVRSLDATYLLALYENYKIDRIMTVLREEYSKGTIPMKMVINVYNYVKDEYNTVTHPEVEKPFGEDLKTLFILRDGLLGGHHG